MNRTPGRLFLALLLLACPLPLPAQLQAVTLQLNDRTVVYSRQPQALQAVVAAGGITPLPAVHYLYNGLAAEPVNAGTYTVTAWTEADAVFQASATVTATLVIERRPVKIANLRFRDKTYDASTNMNSSQYTVGGNSFILEGLAEGEAGSDVKVYTRFEANLADKHVGDSKQIYLTNALAGAAADNYSLTTWDGLTAAVHPATVTVSGMVVNDKAYDGTTAATVSLAGTLQSSGTYAGDDIVYNTACVTAAFRDKDIGQNKPLDITTALQGTDGANYVLRWGNLQATITRREVQVTGMAVANKVYDGTTAAAITSHGYLSGVLPADSGKVTLNTGGVYAAFAGKTVGTHPVVLSGQSSLAGEEASNYAAVISSLGLTADITPRTVTISSVQANDKVYDGTTAATVSWGTLTNAVPGDEVAIDDSGITANFAAAQVHLNIYVSTAGNIALRGTDAGNYQLAGVPADWGLHADITPKPLTLANTLAADKTYDGTTAATIAYPGDLQGVVAPDDVHIDTTAPAVTAAFATKQAGTARPVSLSGNIALHGTDAGNYTVAALPAALTAPVTAAIHPATLTVPGLAVANKVYDGTTAATVSAPGTLTGIFLPDEVAIDYATATVAFDTKTAAAGKPVAFAAALTGTDAENYTVNRAAIALHADISPKTLTLANAAAADKTYDGTASAIISHIGDLQGVLAPDDAHIDATASAVTAAFATKQVGTARPVTLSGNIALQGADAGNYTVAALPAALTTPVTAAIHSATLTVSGLVVADKVYDAATAATVTAWGMPAGVLGTDDVALITAGITAAFTDKNTGTDKPVALSGNITLSGGDAANYVPLQPAGLRADITAAPLTVTAGDRRKLTGEAIDLGNTAFTVSGLLTGDAVTSVLLTSPGAAASAATGRYPITPGGAAGTGIGNYAITYVTGMLTVIPEARLSGLSANIALQPAFHTDSLTYEAALPCDYAGLVSLLAQTAVIDNHITFDGEVQPGNAGNYPPGQPGDRRRVQITVANEFDRREYTVFITTPFGSELLYRAHHNMLEVIANPANNNGWEFVPGACRWYTGTIDNPLWIAGHTGGVLYLPGGLQPATAYGVEVTLAADGSRRMVCPLLSALPAATVRPLRAYPNPTVSTVTLEGLTPPPAATVTVYSITGTPVAVFRTAGTAPTVDLSSLPAGTYLLRCGEATVRVVKQ